MASIQFLQSKRAAIENHHKVDHCGSGEKYRCGYSVNDFTVKAYLNNFPHVLFLGLLARYMMDALSYCKNKKNTYYLDVVSDEMSFINDLITKVE